MKYIVLLLLSILFFSCEEKSSFNFEAGQDFYLIDKNGNDLLDPSHPNSYNKGKIKIYYLINGSKIESSQWHRQERPNVTLDNPYGFSIIKPITAPGVERETYSIGIALSDVSNKDGDIVYTYIEWNENDTDTIASRITIGDNSYRSTMVSFNDFMWSPTQKEPIFTIVK